MTEISRKLADISAVMSDGYKFIVMRELLEQWQQEADEGNAEAARALVMVSQFHRLCLAVKKFLT